MIIINSLINFLKRIYYSSNHYVDKAINNSKKQKQIEQKYSKYINMHYLILEKVKSGLYSDAINSENIDNDYSTECIKICYKDLEIAPFIIQWQKELATALKRDYVPLDYGSHKYLINILKKQNKIEEAINVCDKYIELGLIDDGTKGGIIKRKEDLLKVIKK